MSRKGKVVLRVYEQEFDAEQGKGRRYRFRTYGVKSMLDKILLGDMVKHHFEGTATEDDILYALWQATSDEDWEEFANKPEEQWTKLQRAAYDCIWEGWACGSGASWMDIQDRMLNFVEGYERGYKQAEADWGLPAKSAQGGSDERR